MLKLVPFAVLLVLLPVLIVLGVILYSGGGSDKTASGTAALVISGDDPLTEAVYQPQGSRPLIGEDHWHALYKIFIGDQRQPNAPTWESGVHTHGDGIIHIHPFTHEEEGVGAALNKWFEYGGGELTETSMREPGMSESKTVHNGDPVPGDGRPGQVYVILDGSCQDGLNLVGQWLRVPVNYIPQDGNCLRIMFEPEEVMRAHIMNPPRVPSKPGSTSDSCDNNSTSDLCNEITPVVSGTAPPP